MISRKFFGEDTIVFYLEDWIYKEDYIWNLNEALSDNFLKGFGIEELKEGIIASGSHFVLFVRNTT
jgi:DNA mismatch repair protein MutS